MTCSYHDGQTLVFAEIGLVARGYRGGGSSYAGGASKEPQVVVKAGREREEKAFQVACEVLKRGAFIVERQRAALVSFQ